MSPLGETGQGYAQPPCLEFSSHDPNHQNFCAEGLAELADSYDVGVSTIRRTTRAA